MQWVVTTGRTVDDARAQALDALGIDEADLEWEVLDEPRSSLFGLRTTEARIRARVRPTRPRPKIDRRNRRKTAPRGRRRKSKKSAADRTAAGASADARDAGAGDAGRGGAPTSAAPQERRSGDRAKGRRKRDSEPARDDAPAASGLRSAPHDASQPDTSPSDTSEHDHDTNQSPAGRSPAEASGASMSDIPLSEQEETAVGFVEGLLEAFGADAEVASSVDDDDTLEITVDGDDLGLLVGQRGATLNALQELTRTAVAQQHSGRLEGRLRVDVAGYRARRKEALIRFVGQQADRVKETGDRVALEPMSPPDRKIVHDAVNEIDGVRTVSEGEDRRRHVVILPDD